MKRPIIILSLILISGCSLFSDDGDSDRVVEGMYFKQINDLGEGTWRDPPDFHRFQPPGENPIDDPLQSALVIIFDPNNDDELEQDTLRLRIEPLSESKETISAYRKRYGGKHIKGRSVYEEEFISRDGYRSIQYVNLVDREGNRLRRGFYRVHLGAEYHDFFITGSIETRERALEYLREIE